MSRVLAIHRYYWPDSPPYAAMLRSIARQWMVRGHEVDVLTSQPSYKPETQNVRRPRVEVVDDVRVHRIAMRPDRSAPWRQPFNVLWFPAVVALRILIGRRYDVVMCSTAPPVLLGWAVSLAARVRGARFIYHCMDLHPEIGRLSGDFTNPLLYRLLARLELGTCRRASAIVVLSEDMRRAVEARDLSLAERTEVLTNFELPDHDAPAEPAASPLAVEPGRLRVVFAGNVGRFQGLEAIVEAVLVEDPALDPVQIVFMGEGGAKAGLLKLVEQAAPSVRDRVVFLPHSSPAVVRALLATAQLGLVSLTPGVIQYAYPSKTAMYLACAVPVLVAVEPDSALAALVEERGVGGLLPGRDPEGVRKALRRWIDDPAGLADAARAAKDVWLQEYAAPELLPRWTELLERVVGRTVVGA